ncbi:hypothetical protein FB451DRAFT_1412525 [Mycena latifolia]|nr:hypothetical protein FB451DRAFT_1412525 [Mycena latifolia]
MLALPIVTKSFIKHELSFEAVAEVGEDLAFRKLMRATSQSLGLEVGEMFAAEVMTTIGK